MLDKFRETTIVWDKANRKVYEPLRVSAGDNKGRKLSVQVVNGGVIESLSGASLSLFWETKDKAHNGLDAFETVDAAKGEFEIYYKTGMLSNVGTLNANLVLVDASGRIVSEPFTITVFKGIDDDAIQSSDSFTALTEALAQVGTINNKADRDELLALESTFEQNKVSVEQQLQQKTLQFSNIEKMKLERNFTEKSYVTTTGYYEAGDGGGANYIIKKTSLPHDNGSVINLSDGFQAHLLNDGVDCAMFGATKSKELLGHQVNTIFDAWTNFVNKTDGKYFEVKENSYHLYKPLYIRKSFIGIGLPSFMMRAEGIGSTVSTDTTADGKFSFNVEAVMGIHPFIVTDTEERFTIKNFKIFCTNTDDDVSPAQKIGVYFPQGNSFSMDNIVVVRPHEAGFVLKENWMADMSRLNVWKSRGKGFELIGGFTSLTFKNNYAHGFRTRGFDINGAVYSTFQDLGADSATTKAFASYAFASCWGTTIQSLGSEHCHVDYLLYLGDNVANISNVFALEITIYKAVVYNFTDSVGVIENIRMNKAHKGTGTTPYSFEIRSSGTGDKYNLEIRNLSRYISLDGNNSNRLVSLSKGRVYFNTADSQDIFLSGETGNTNDIVASEVITGGEVIYYSNGRFELTCRVSLGELQITTENGSVYSSSILEWVIPTLSKNVSALDYFNITDFSAAATWAVVRSFPAGSTPAQYQIMSTTSRTLAPQITINLKGKWT